MDFQRCKLDFSSFYNLQLKESSFVECSCLDCDFAEANLTGTNFNKANLQGAVFVGCNLQNANFQEASGLDIDPNKNTLKGAQFELTQLPGLLNQHQIIVIRVSKT